MRRSTTARERHEEIEAAEKGGDDETQRRRDTEKPGKILCLSVSLCLFVPGLLCALNSSQDLPARSAYSQS
jgi:hypothetical protein